MYIYKLNRPNLSQSLCSADGGALLLPVILQFTRHAPVLRDQCKQLRVRHVLGLCICSGEGKF